MVGCVWYLDSGASFHMTGNKSLFITLKEKYLKMRIEMGDDGKYCVSGEGMVVFQRELRPPLTLSDVKYVAGLKENLVSVAMLEDKGYDVVFRKGKAFLRHIAMAQTKRIGIRVKNIYKLEVDDYVALSSKAEMVQSKDIGELWHRSRSKEILEQVHTDVYGPLSTASITKQRYYVILIDDFSRKFWIYFTQKKDQTFSKFFEFKSLVEKESGKKIRALRSENGGEYVSQDFKDFCVAEGIKQELTTPHNPHQNGVAERKNIIIGGAPRVMLHDQGLPLHLWAEACNTMVYL
eukprot:PITA_27300